MTFLNNSNRKKVDLTVANYATVKENKYDLAILPWGATEPHNLHLPYTTDAILSHAIAVDLALHTLEESGIYCMVLPPVYLGSQNPGQHTLPFCIHGSYDTQRNILRDTVAALYQQGLRKLIIFNGHGGNSFKNMIRDLYLDFPDFLIATTEWYTHLPQQGYFDEKIDDHAGETETAVMMHYYPDLACLDQAGDGDSTPFKIESLNQKLAWVPRHWDKTTADTGIGNPKKASAEKGARFVRDTIKTLSPLFTQLAREELY